MRSRPRVWLFDLDNTLHDANLHIFPRINRAMTDYMVRHLDLVPDEAARLRQHYWERYGATLLGLMRHHKTDPDHFLQHTHALPDLHRLLVTERSLRNMLRRLPGNKLVFSNAPLQYTETVLRLTGIAPCFAAVYSVERLRYQPKPATGGFLRLLFNERLDPRRCILVEDSLANLKKAKRLGMKTVWVSACTRQPPYVDVRISSILDLPQRLGQL